MTRREVVRLCGAAMLPDALSLKYRTYPVRSANQLYECSLRVLEPARATGRILYILPVNPDISHRWGDGFETAIRLGLHDKHGFTLAAPTFSAWPWFADHPSNPKIRQESYFTGEIVPMVDKLFPRHKRLLVGFSKSGNGALTLLFRHPDLFAAAAAWDAPLMKEAPDQFGMAEIFGNAEAFRQYSIPRLLEEGARRFAAEKPRIALLGYDAFEEHMRKAHEAMQRLNIPHHYDNRTRRAHRWDTGWLEGACRLLDEMSRT
jgi:hypothetical protein